MSSSPIPGQPGNINTLNPLGFRFVIKKLPNVNYFCQNVAIPSVSVDVANYPTPLTDIPLPGTKLRYEPLNIRFKVDEDLNNYIEVYNWLQGLGSPISLQQTYDLSRQAPVPTDQIGKASSYVSDGSLIILTSHKNPNIQVRFVDIWPINLSELQFDTTDSDVVYMEATASFRFTYFTISTV